MALTQGIRAPDLVTGGWFDVSPSGTLLYMPGVMVGSQRQLAMVDQDGEATIWSDERHEFTFNPALTRDGRQLAVAIADLAEGVYEIWTSLVDRAQLRPLVDRPATDCAWPAWMPGGRRLLFTCFGHNDPGGLYIMDAGNPGEEELLVSQKVGQFAVATSISSDGKWAIVMRGDFSTFEVTALLLDEPGAEMTTLLPATEGVQAAYLSPDDRWVSFSSPETGRREMYIAPFRDGKLGSKRTVSLGGGDGGLWIPRPDGRHVLTYASAGRVFGVTVTSEPALSLSEPVELFDAQALRMNGMAAFPDGRFLIIQRGEDEDATPPIHLVINWTQELKERLP